MAAFEEIVDLLAEVLQLGNRARHMDRNTALLGSIPELDSMAVVSVLTAVEDRYGIVIDDDDIDAEAFETLGSLHDFINRRISA